MHYFRRVILYLHNTYMSLYIKTMLTTFFSFLPIFMKSGVQLKFLRLFDFNQFHISIFNRTRIMTDENCDKIAIFESNAEIKNSELYLFVSQTLFSFSLYIFTYKVKWHTSFEFDIWSWIQNYKSSFTFSIF